MQLLYDFLISTMAVILETWNVSKYYTKCYSTLFIQCAIYKKDNKCYTFYDY